MNFSPEKIPYFDSEGNVVDFGKKRLEFWTETVPSDIRRLEYELYKRQRSLFHANLYQFEHKKKLGRFTYLPGFSEDLRDEAWEGFKGSFLQGEERRKRFSEILGSAEKDLPELLEKNSEVIPESKIKLIALGGSSAFGPRRPNERLSDIDLNFLIDEEGDENNFDILPSEKDASEITPYHLFGTGSGDNARGNNREIHWLLYPHFPVRNSLPDEELKSIISKLVVSTQERKEQILESIENLDNQLKQKSEPGAIE